MQPLTGDALEALLIAYSQLEAMSDAELAYVQAAATYTRLTRTTIQQMTLEQLVAATDAARVLLSSETDEGVRNALLDGINAIDIESRRRNATNPQRVEGRLTVGNAMEAAFAAAVRN